VQTVEVFESFHAQLVKSTELDEMKARLRACDSRKQKYSEGFAAKAESRFETIGFSIGARIGTSHSVSSAQLARRARVS
jgi:hypothetical protein